MTKLRLVMIPGTIDELIEYCEAHEMMFECNMAEWSQLCEIVARKTLFALVWIEW